MTTMQRRTFLALILALGTLVAFLPRVTGPSTAPPPPAATTADPPPPDLVELRAEAALRPCPAPAPGTTARGPLAGVRVTCLGDGTTVDLGAALAGRTVLINLWAPGYQPCRQELPVLDEYAKSADAVPVLTVQVRGGPADGLGLLTDLSVRLPTVHDTDGAVAEALGAPSSPPVSYLVHPDGTVHRLGPPTPFATPDEIRAVVA